MHTAPVHDNSWPTSETSNDADLAALARRAARLDHTLKTMEALEAFRTEAAALRAELRAVRDAAARPAPAQPAPQWTPRELPEGLLRLVGEAGFLVAIAATVSSLDLGRPAIVTVMGSAWLLTALFEAFATRGFGSAWAGPAYWPLPANPAPAPANGAQPPFEHTLVGELQARVPEARPEQPAPTRV